MSAASKVTITGSKRATFTGHHMAVNHFNRHLQLQHQNNKTVGGNLLGAGITVKELDARFFANPLVWEETIFFPLTR